LPGIEFFWCEGGPAVANAVRGFVKVEAGTNFPDHEHIGDEIVLVLQGSFVDTSRNLTFHAGDSDIMKAGTSHAYTVPAGGPDLLKLSVTQVGLRAMGHTYLPR
jgi:anti-sigma factor ChrR (cupin superfamily)